MAAGTITDRPVTELTITRTENNIINATNMGGVKAFSNGEMLFLYINCKPSSSVTLTDFTEIARISGWNACSDAYITIPSQSNPSVTMIWQIYSNGTLRVYSAQQLQANVFFRGSIAVPCSE